MDKWRLAHAYVSNDDVPAILCPNDNETRLHVVDRNGEPALRCMTCDTVYTPGKQVWTDMEKNLDEYNRSQV